MDSSRGAGTTTLNAKDSQTRDADVIHAFWSCIVLNQMLAPWTWQT